MCMFALHPGVLLNQKTLRRQWLIQHGYEAMQDDIPSSCQGDYNSMRYEGIDFDESCAQFLLGGCQDLCRICCTQVLFQFTDGRENGHFLLGVIEGGDANHAGCVDTRKSTSRGIQFLGDKLVSWMSKKQDCIARPQQWMNTWRQLIAISLHPYSLRTKAHPYSVYLSQEQVENGIIELYFVRTEYQLADMFTKALPEERFQYLVRRIGMRCLTPAELEIPSLELENLSRRFFGSTDTQLFPKLTTHDDDIIHEEETDEDDSFDTTIQTPSRNSSLDDEDSDNEVEGANVEGAKSDENATYEEDQGNEAVEDNNTDLDGRDDVMTDVILPHVSLEIMSRTMEVRRIFKRAAYKALVDAYERLILCRYIWAVTVSLKRPRGRRKDYRTGSKTHKQSASQSAPVEETMQTTDVFEAPAHQEFKIGVHDEQAEEEVQHLPGWFQQPTRLPSPDHAWNKSVPAVQESVPTLLANWQIYGISIKLMKTGA
ncbi:hypothetical protein Tco_0264818 [Tanacetum coccineum]